jgi:hypothetical protein
MDLELRCLRAVLCQSAWSLGHPVIMPPRAGIGIRNRLWRAVPGGRALWGQQTGFEARRAGQDDARR